jgi:putative oxidoreductase
LILRLGVNIPVIHDWIPGLSRHRAAESVAAAAGILLLAGLWTPFVGAAVAGVELWLALFGHSSADDGWTHFSLAVMGVSLALIGPGAWSVDARLFGRKLFHVVHRARER